MNKMSMITVLGLSVLSSTAFATDKQSLEYPSVPGEVVVKVKKGQVENFLSQKNLGATVTKQMSLLTGDYVVLKSHNKTTVSLVNNLKRSPEVEYVEPNYIYSIVKKTPGVAELLRGEVATVSDPRYGALWGLKNTGENEPDRFGNVSTNRGVAGADINAERAWEITKGSRDVVIAVIDTGIDYTHPDLVNQMWVNEGEIPGDGIDNDGNGYIDDVYGWNAALDHGNPMDGNDHGTHCAGTIGAEHNNGIGVAGVMGDVRMMAVKFLTDAGGGTLADAVEAIDYATKMNVDIMSNSWGGGGYSQALYDSIYAAYEKGILFVAAAGNDGSNNDSRPQYPANYEVPNVISVASHTAQDSLSSFSCYGKRTVHIAAPGSNVLSTTPKDTYQVFSGTSMATPHVSGALGLLIAQEGRLPVEEVKERLMKTSVPTSAYRKKIISGGRLDAYNLLTDTRPERNEPADDAWRVEALPEVFETEHPYQNNQRFSQTYTFPGAKYVKIILEKYDLERNYDFITLKDGKGAVVEKISGAGEGYESDYAETDTITIEFSSDRSQNRWGAVIREVKVIY
ncbi:MAG: S8 family serine peptidase [Candidatus Caldatribacteriota bacterium]